MIIMKFFKGLFQKNLSVIINYVLKHFNIFIIFRIGNAIGDQICMSSVIRLINEQYPFRIVVISSFPELFDNNPRLWRNFGVKVNYVGSYIAKILRFVTGERIENFLFKSDLYSMEEYMREKNSKLHLAEVHAMHFKIFIDFHEITNELYLSEQEIKKYQKKFNLPNTFSLIQPNPKTTYTPNKQWGIGKYQEVVNQLNQINWIQVGVADDIVMDNVENYVGKTSLRELAFLIKNAEFILADEGLLNHIASSVDTISFVVYSGFSRTELAQYKKTIPVVQNPQVECSPCWLKGNCPQKIKLCTEGISVKQVINTLQELKKA
jgi:ADP-heptose:LPS heptosyltransferase